MKSGSLGKLTTRINTWELLYDNALDHVCTFDFRIINKSTVPTIVDLLITPIPLHLLPAHEADYYVIAEPLEGKASFDKKGIVIGEFDYVYTRSSHAACVVTVNGFVDVPKRPNLTIPYYYLVSEGAKTADTNNVANFVLIAENVPTGTNVPYSIGSIALNRIQSISVNGVTKPVVLNDNFTVNNKYSVLSIRLIDNVNTINGEKITLSCNGVNISKFVNCLVVPAATYNLTANRSTVNEGESIVFTLATTNLPEGTTVPYTIGGTVTAGVDYSGTNTGNFVINSSGVGTITRTIIADDTTEGSSNESMIVSLTGRPESVTVGIIDSSQSGGGGGTATYY